MRDSLELCDGAWAWHDPDFLGDGHGERLRSLLDEVPWRQRQVTVWNRTYDEPRLASWHGDAGCVYTYSRLELAPEPWTPVLAELRDRLQAACDVPFNTVLANLYRDGSDRMGWHADDEPCFGEDPVIASLSLGHPRRFRLKHRHDPNDQHVLELGEGALLVMGGATQRHYRHALGRTARAVAPRINLTYRHYLHPTA